MKVCHISSVHPKDDARIFHKECVSLATNGYDIILLVSGPEKTEIINNMKIIQIGAVFKNRIDRIRRSKKLFYNAAIDADADIYHIHDPELIPVGIKLKKSGKVVIFDSHEDIPMTIYDKHWIPASLRSYVSEAYKFYEASALKKFDALVTVTPDIVKKLKRINEKTVLITNYPILGIQRNQACEDNFTRKNDVAFAGLIGPLYNHDAVIKAIRKVEGLRYKIAGKPNDQSYLEFLKHLDGWTEVDYYGLIPHNEIYNFYRTSMAGVSISNHDLNGGEDGSLGVLKNFEIMAAGIPLICSNTKVWAEIIAECGCGICVSPQNIDEVEAAIKFLKENPSEAKVMGEKGRIAVETKYNWNTQEKVLLQLYGDLSKSILA
jgi:glycosyltransferase involved in cell wall biosynthesis